MPTLVDAELPGDERGALLAFVEAQRGGLRRALLGLSDEEASRKPSASGLSLAGLLKHVVEVEEGWLLTAQALPPAARRSGADWDESFRLAGKETVQSVLARWETAARRTEEYVRSVADLDAAFPLPEAPWFPEGARRSQRWYVLHLVEEIARHAGHADVIRESLDGRTAYELIALEAGPQGAEDWMPEAASAEESAARS